jgi:ligand-binding sensor domain-containing protein
MSIEGVHRFDGKTVVDFPLDERIWGILCDRDGVIWANSREHVYRFKDDRHGFLTIASADSLGAPFGRIFQLPGRQPWLHTTKGFFEWNKEEDKFDKLSLEEFDLTSLNASNFNHYDHTVYVQTSDSLYAIDSEEHRHYAIPCGSINGIFPVSDRLVLVTMRGNFSMWFDFNNGQVTLIKPEEDVLNRDIPFLHILDAESLTREEHLLATHGGLLLVNSNTRKFRYLSLYSRGKPLEPNIYYYDVCLDDQGEVWLAHGSGLIHFSPMKEQIGLMRNREQDPDKAWLNSARNFTEDEHGNIWVTTSRGFGKWDLKTNDMHMYLPVEGATDRLNQPSVRGLQYDGHNLIMGTSTAGVWLFDPDTEKYRRPMYGSDSLDIKTKEKLEQDFIRHIIELPTGDYFIAGNNNYVLARTDYHITEFDPPELRGRFADCCYIDSKDNLLYATADTLFYFDKELAFVKLIPVGHGVQSMLEIGTDLYIGTPEGLFTLPHHSDSVELTEIQLLTDETTRVPLICKDKNNILWIGTDDGLYRYDPERKTKEVFDFADNIQSNLFSPNATYLTRSGMLIIGGFNGINYFHPSRVRSKRDSLDVSLMTVSVNDDDTSYSHQTTPFTLRHFQNIVQVSYVAPYFGNTNRLQYRYRLRGYDNTWKYNGNDGTVRFNYLRPGHYTFEIAASINGRNWFESREPLKFTILKPFWQQTWFILLSIVASITVLILIMRKRIRDVRKQETERRRGEVQLLTMNHDLAASRLTALRAQMNPHFIFNALNSVQRYILKGDVDQANKYLSKFSRLQREVLNNSSQDFISLEKELEILELYLQLEQLRFDEQFSYRIHLDKEIDAGEIQIPPMILQPFIENAIWHGLMPGSGAKQVDISFSLNGDDQLYCKIVDNGIGREASERLKQNQDKSTRHVSKGLSLVNERLKLLQQLYHHPYEVQVIDRVDENGVARGTEVVLSFHVGR